MRSRKRMYQAVAVVCVVLAVVLIQHTVNQGFMTAYAGERVNVAAYLLKLIGAVVLVYGGIYAGIKSSRLR